VTAVQLVCIVCGTPLVPGARFCFACGSPQERSEELEASAERRFVTVLFGDLSDFTAWAEELDPEQVGAVADRALAAMSHAVTEVGGHVDKLTGDGIMAVFGAPTAHEDDAERAVRAAATMQTEIRRLMEAESGGGRRLGLRVGLNTGEVIAGIQAHLSYTVIGDTVNTAARLSDAAGVGRTWAGRETALASLHVASWRALPAVRLKGKREPFEAFELVAIRPPGQTRLGLGAEAPFVGRDAERGVIVGRVMDVIDRGQPVALVVTGEAGVGKTRLVSEVTRFAGELPDLRVLQGRARPYGEGRELSVFVDWLRVACGITDMDSPAEAVARLRRTVTRLADAGPLGLPVAALIDRLLPLIGVEGEPSIPRESAAPGGSGVAGDPIRLSVLRLLAGLAAEGPLLLVADDLQWADAGLLRDLGWVAGKLSGPVIVICVGRSELPAGPEGDWWRTLPNPELIPLLPLDSMAAGRLLRAYLGGAELEPGAQQALLRRAQGNPFFLAELLNLLVDRGLLRRTGASWTLVGELPPDVLPAGVQAVLAARIDALDTATKTVLRDAAVVGPRFALTALLAVDPEAAALVVRSVAELVERGILAPAEDEESGRTYVFSHALTRDVAYAGIPKAERARRHAIAAVWAVANLAAPAAEVDTFVAAHAERAIELATEMGLGPGDPAWRARPSGVRALGRLASAALSREDNVRAERLYTKALGFAEGAGAEGDLLDLQVGRAAARAALHRISDAEADLAGPLESDNLPIRAAALVVLGRLRAQRGHDDAATAAFVSALATASDSGVNRVTAEALRELGLVDYRAGRLPGAEARFGQALDLAERIGDVRGTGWALQHLAWSATTRGDYQLAESMLARAADVFGSLDDSGGLSWCAGTEAFVRLLQGRLHEARELARGLLPLGEAMGERWGVAACLTIDAFAAAELGDLDIARDEAARAHTEFADLADTWGRSMSLAARAFAERGAARPDLAIDLFEQAVGASELGSHPVTGSLALCGIGYCQLDRGDPKAARLAAERAVAMLDGLELEPAALVGTQVLLAQAIRAEGDLAEALRLLADVADVTDEPSLLFPRRQALAHYAGALLEAGDVHPALAVIHRALAVPAEDVRSRVVALRVLAQCLAAAGDPPAARLAARQAEALARSTEQVSERPTTRRLLAGLLAGNGV